MSEWTLNNTVVSIERGNLAERTIPAIALGVKPDWTPGGPASGAVLSAGGEVVRKAIGNLSPADTGTINTIDSGDLPCEKIYLVAMATESEPDVPDNWLRHTYDNLLESVREDGFSELALPPLGLGDFDWSIDRTSTAAIETFEQFSHGSNHFNRIELVVYDAIEYSSVENFADNILGDNQAEPDAEQRLRDYY